MFYKIQKIYSSHHVNKSPGIDFINWLGPTPNNAQFTPNFWAAFCGVKVVCRAQKIGIGCETIYKINPKTSTNRYLAKSRGGDYKNWLSDCNHVLDILICLSIDGTGLTGFSSFIAFKSFIKRLFSSNLIKKPCFLQGMISKRLLSIWESRIKVGL